MGSLADGGATGTGGTAIIAGAATGADFFAAAPATGADVPEADDEAAGVLVAQDPNVLVALLTRSVPEL